MAHRTAQWVSPVGTHRRGPPAAPESWVGPELGHRWSVGSVTGTGESVSAVYGIKVECRYPEWQNWGAVKWSRLPLNGTGRGPPGGGLR